MTIVTMSSRRSNSTITPPATPAAIAMICTSLSVVGGEGEEAVVGGRGVVGIVGGGVGEEVVGREIMVGVEVAVETAEGLILVVGEVGSVQLRAYEGREKVARNHSSCCHGLQAGNTILG